MAKPLTNLQHAAKTVIANWVTGDLAGAVNQLEEALENELSSRRSVGRPRVVAHDPAKGKSCMCIDCRKARKLRALVEHFAPSAKEEKS